MLLLFGRATSPESSRKQFHFCSTLKENRRGDILWIRPPDCQYIRQPFLCQRDFEVKLQSSSRTLLVFSGPFETRGSGEGEEVGSLNSECFSYVINLASAMGGLTGLHKTSLV